MSGYAIDDLEKLVLRVVKVSFNIRPMESSNAFNNVRYKMLKKYLKENWNVTSEADLIVTIGNERMFCKKMILRFHSKEYQRMEKHIKQTWDLTEEAISMVGLKKAYEWMAAKQAGIDIDYVLPTLQASSFLRVGPLCGLCWDTLGKFYDRDALTLYLETRRRWGSFPVVETCLLKRIGSIYLKLVSTKDYLYMTAELVRQFAAEHATDRKRTLESFMSLVHWLNFQWQERKHHAFYLMKIVPFNMFPTWYLFTLLKGGTQDDVCVYNVVNDLQVREVLKLGFVIKTASIAPVADQDNFEKVFMANDKNRREELERMFDALRRERSLERTLRADNPLILIEEDDAMHKMCVYPMQCEHCPLKDVLTYSAFKEYLGTF